jgi:hypothetical protein
VINTNVSLITKKLRQQIPIKDQLLIFTRGILEDIVEEAIDKA